MKKDLFIVELSGPFHGEKDLEPAVSQSPQCRMMLMAGVTLFLIEGLGPRALVTRLLGSIPANNMTVSFTKSLLPAGRAALAAS